MPVELGFMPTTTDKRTAFDYSGEAKRRGTVFEISVGRIDAGASLSFLSQYPGEEEFLMPPLSCLEVAALSAHSSSQPSLTKHNTSGPPPTQQRLGFSVPFPCFSSAIRLIIPTSQPPD
jgi:hypothetical protein